MTTNSSLLCIHRDPAQLSLLKQNGYELVTARSGSDGLRLLMSQSVDVVVLDYELSLLDGATTVAAEINDGERRDQMATHPGRSQDGVGRQQSKSAPIRKW